MKKDVIGEIGRYVTDLLKDGGLREDVGEGIKWTIEGTKSNMWWIYKGAEQNLRDFRRYVLKDKNMSRNTHEYIEVIKWHEARIYRHLKLQGMTESDKGKILRSMQYIINYADQLVSHRNYYHEDGDKYRKMTDENIKRILLKINKVIDISVLFGLEDNE